MFSKLRPLFSAVSKVLFGTVDSNPNNLPRSYLSIPEGMQPTPCQMQQVAHNAAASFTDTLYYIAAELPATYDASGYGDTGMDYILIDRVEQFPEFGSERAVNEFKPISGAVEKSKGSPNYMGGVMTLADMPTDPGQVICKAAEASSTHYSMKLLYPDGEIHYLDVLVASWKLAQAAEGGFMKRMANIQLCKAPVIVAA